MSTYTEVSAKLGKVSTPTKSMSKEIFDAAKKAGHEIWYMWGMGSSSEHASGRALDLMVRNEAAGDWIRNYIWANRQRLRLQHVIWEQHITSTVTQPGVRRKMADRGNTTNNHYDHIHVLFFAGTYRAPVPTTPTKPAPSKPVPTTPTKPAKKSNDLIADEVIGGLWGDGFERTQKLRVAGYDPNVIQRLVNIKLEKKKALGKKKTIGQIASEVIDKKWGNGAERVASLTRAGYDPAAVQKEVNRLLGVRTRKSVDQIANEIMEGKGDWGNGDVRVQRLTRAGYNAKAIQAKINRLMR